jgi:hypothetical protein
MKNNWCDCHLIVVTKSLAAGRRSLLDQHGANLALRGDKFVEAVQEQGLRVGARGGRGFNFRRCDVGGFGTGFAVTRDEWRSPFRSVRRRQS